MKVKSIDALMKYLREEKSLKISGSIQKRHLRNIGYYHGYKGYRFYSTPNNMLCYKNFNELESVYDFDMQIKSLLYPKIMFLETAFKNYALEEILVEVKSGRFADVYSNALTFYKKFSIGSKEYKNQLKKRMKLRNNIYSDLSRDYEKKLIVQNFYHKDKPVPIWAIFELISFGEFGSLLSTLDPKIKLKLSKSIGFNRAFDTDGSLTQTIVYILKDLRNAIAHNDTVFDTRFKSSKISNKISNYLTLTTGINNITFATIVDYIILIAYLLSCFKISKTEIKKFIKDFMACYESLRSKIPINIYNKIIHTDTRNKLINLEKYLC